MEKTMPASANLQSHIDRVIQTLKHVILNGFLVLNDQQLDLILRWDLHPVLVHWVSNENLLQEMETHWAGFFVNPTSLTLVATYSNSEAK